MKENSTPIFGILSLIFGVIGLIIFPYIFGTIGLILGIIGINKEENKVLSIIGLCLAGINIIWVIIKLAIGVSQSLKMVAMCLLK